MDQGNKIIGNGMSFFYELSTLSLGLITLSKEVAKK